MSTIYNIQKPDGTRVQCLKAGQNIVYMKNGRPGLIRIVIGGRPGGTHMTCLVHQDILESRIPTLKPLLGHMLQNPNLLTGKAIQYRHARPIMLLYLIDALYVDRYMLHRPFDQQGLKQAANANGLILHTDMFRVARRLKFDQVEWEAKQQLIGFINFFSASASSNPVFLEALIWLYSNLDPGDWEIRRVFCFWLAYGLKSFGQPMRDDIVTASQMLPLFKSDLKEKLREVPGFNVPGFTI